jgi:fructose-1,6-bisphosphatase/inositol monophosphatase family enzyme
MFVHDGSAAIGLYEDACGRPLGYVEAHINPCDCRGSAVAVLKRPELE